LIQVAFVGMMGWMCAFLAGALDQKNTASLFKVVTIFLVVFYGLDLLSDALAWFKELKKLPWQ
jgi:hypothetical protein